MFFAYYYYLFGLANTESMEENLVYGPSITADISQYHIIQIYTPPRPSNDLDTINRPISLIFSISYEPVNMIQCCHQGLALQGKGKDLVSGRGRT